MKKILQKIIYPILIITFILFLFLFFLKNIDSIIENYDNFSMWLFPKNDDRNGELFKIILSVLGALGILFGLYVSLRRAKAIEEGVRIQSKAINIQSSQIELSRKAQIDERFKNAVEHLGNEKEPVILGGIAELHQLAKENRINYSEIVFNILTSYIRSNSNLKNNRTIIQTIMNCLFSNVENNPYIEYKADLNRTDLIGIDLSNKILNETNLSYSKISIVSNTDLTNSNLSNSIFFFSRIENVNFNNSKFYKTLFFGGGIKNCEFNLKNDFPTVDFVDVDIENIEFNKNEIHNWNFIVCDISNCSFNNINILYSKFCLNNFTNVEFLNIGMLNKIDFRGSYFKNTTIKNSSITVSNFNGCRVTDEFTISQIESISRLLEYKTNINGIDIIDCLEHQNSYNQIIQEDLNEIIEIYNNCKNRAFKKD